jgi:hypothetical protein
VRMRCASGSASAIFNSQSGERSALRFERRLRFVLFRQPPPARNRKIGHHFTGVRAEGLRHKPLAFFGTGTIVGRGWRHVAGVPSHFERERGHVSLSRQGPTDRSSDAGTLAVRGSFTNRSMCRPYNGAANPALARPETAFPRLARRRGVCHQQTVALRDRPRRRPRPPLYWDFPRLCSRSPGARKPSGLTDSRPPNGYSAQSQAAD